MAAPTLASYAESAWTSATGTTKTVSGVSWQTGDVVIVTVGIENTTAQLSSVTATGLTFTPTKSIYLGGVCPTYMYQATATSAGSGTITATKSNTTTMNWGMGVYVYRGSAGVGASTTGSGASGAPSVSVTTTQANSAIVMIGTDWNAVDGSTTRVWRTGAGTVTEETYQYVPSIYTVYGGYAADAGATGTKVVGLSAPAGQAYGFIAAEIKGSTSSALSGSVALSGAGTLSGTASSVSVSGASSEFGSGTLSLGFPYPSLNAATDFSGSGVLTLSGSASQIGAGSLDLSGSGALTLSGTPTFGGNLALSGGSALGLTGQPGAGGALGLSGGSAFGTASSLGTTGALDLSGSSTLALTGGPRADGTLTLSGGSTLGLSGILGTAGALALSGGGALGLDAKPGVGGSLSLSGGGSATFSGPTTGLTTYTFPTGTTGWTPGAFFDDGAAGMSLGFQFVPHGTDLTVRKIRIYQQAGTTITGYLWASDGTQLAHTATVTATAGWNELDFTTPVLLTDAATYIISYYQPTQIYSFLANAWVGGQASTQFSVEDNRGKYVYGTDPYMDINTPQTQAWHGVDLVATSGTEASSESHSGSVLLSGSGSLTLRAYANNLRYSWWDGAIETPVQITGLWDGSTVNPTDPRLS